MNSSAAGRGKEDLAEAPGCLPHQKGQVAQAQALYISVLDGLLKLPWPSTAHVSL